MSEKLQKFPKHVEEDNVVRYAAKVDVWKEETVAALQKLVNEDGIEYVCRICHMDSACEDDCIATVKLREVMEALKGE